MCHGQPSTHPCSHTSITWHYCSSAPLDLDTGYEAPCMDTSFAVSLATPSDCPLQNCQFKDMGGSWTCCVCGRGPNTRGWCTMPAAKLNKDPETSEVEAVQATGARRSPTPDFPFSDIQRSPRNHADRGSSRGPALPSDEAQPSSSVASSLSSSASSPPGYAIDLDYSSVGKKNRSMGKKGQKGHH